MSEEIRKRIYGAVSSENPIELFEISELFRAAGNNSQSIFKVFKMACPWLDAPEYERLMGIAEEGAPS